jgi:probable F420-dependent oxidoreductase
MADLRFGIGLRRLESLVRDARKAEALGYDFVSTGEHVFFHGPVANGLIALAAAAGATERIEIMSAITLLPLYPPALLAKQVATLDVVSGGRFHLGVGVGGEYPPEFEACGVPVKERGARTDESLAVMRALWTQDDVRFQGRFTALSGVTLEPKPVRKPHPPIWISGRSDAAMARAARHGTGWLPYMYTPQHLASSLSRIGTLAADLGRTGPVEPAVFLFFAVHARAQEAVTMATERLSRQYNQDFSRLVAKYAVAGNPDDCVTRLREYVDAGARTLLLNSACPDEYVAENERLLCAEVLPVLRALE